MKEAVNIKSCIDQLQSCHERTFRLSLKLDSMSDLLEMSFESSSNSTLMGLGCVLKGFEQELSGISRDIERVQNQFIARDNEKEPPRAPLSV